MLPEPACAEPSTAAVTGLKDGGEFETAFDPETGAFGLVSLNDGVSAVPEPATLGLLAAACSAMLASLRRRPRP